MPMIEIILSVAVAAVTALLFRNTVRIVPERQAFIVERLGKYDRTLGAGFHLLIPFVERIAYRQSLKEEAMHVHPQTCVTADNVQLNVDGILYLRVVDPEKASYGIDNYRYASTQLAQTTMRSEMGRIDLDRSFSERDEINDAIVRAVDEASDPWGIKVTRYEVRDISPPDSVLQAMEQQMRAEREKRAAVLQSEGERAARINVSKGQREEAINLSKGERQRRINEAAGRARAIEATATATADGIRQVAQAIRQRGGDTAFALRIADQYVAQFGRILEGGNVSVMPLEVAQVRSILQTVLGRSTSTGEPPAADGES